MKYGQKKLTKSSGVGSGKGNKVKAGYTQKNLKAGMKKLKMPGMK